ncbi:MAG: hypothetical protein ACOC44_12335 [Promethearchaeia archaeon]
MTTRAIITIEKEPFVATHVDGYPSSLGQALIDAYPTTKYKIIKVAQKHDIDYIEKSFLEKLNEARIQEIAHRNDLSIEQVKNGVRRVVQSNRDHLISDIASYPDWCEYQYNLNKNKRWEVSRYENPPWHGTMHHLCDLEEYLKWRDLLRTLDWFLYKFKKVLKKR